MKTITSFLTTSILLVGCAGTTPMAVGPDHPANPDAPIAPLPSPSTTLAIAAAPTTATATGSADSDTSAHDGHGAGHAHHGAAATTQPHAAEGATTQSQMQALYTCPMHAEVVSDKPGRCPKCRMNLVKKKGAAR